MTLEYGRPIYPESLSKEEKRNLEQYTQDVILHMLKKNSSENAAVQ